MGAKQWLVSMARGNSGFIHTDVPRRYGWGLGLYVSSKFDVANQPLNSGLSLYCLNSSVSSFSSAVITRLSAPSCSIRAFAGRSHSARSDRGHLLPPSG